MIRAVWIIVAGVVIHLMAAWMKIVHWQNADIAMTTAYVIEAAGLLLLIYAAFFKKPGRPVK